jgi:hypothetical protein
MPFKSLLFLFITSVCTGTAQTDVYRQLAQEAVNLTANLVTYNGAYFSIPYPNGDVPKGCGVCTDVIIRSYRKLEIDLQKNVHEDMKSHFNAYSSIWGLSKTDTNIDHRRVPYLRRFFERKNASLPVSKNPMDYKPGDLVSWLLDNNLTHIGIVLNIPASEHRYKIVHNIGAGQVLEDCLFTYTITGHYRYEK